MKKLLVIIFASLSIIATSCVSKDKYEALESDFNYCANKYDELVDKYNELVNDYNELESRINRAKSATYELESDFNSFKSGWWSVDADDIEDDIENIQSILGY